MAASPGERLREWIEDEGLTQADAAERLGCSRVFVTLLLGGRRTVRGLEIALAIERETRSWAKGPITVHEWGAAEGDTHDSVEGENSELEPTGS